MLAEPLFFLVLLLNIFLILRLSILTFDGFALICRSKLKNNTDLI